MTSDNESVHCRATRSPKSLPIEIIKILEYQGHRFVIRPDKLLQVSAANANEPICALAYEPEIGMH